jgi:hypothetical protein
LAGVQHCAVEEMLANACSQVCERKTCGGAILRRKGGDCCVFYSYGDVPRLPIQEELARARGQSLWRRARRLA